MLRKIFSLRFIAYLAVETVIDYFILCVLFSPSLAFPFFCAYKVFSFSPLGRRLMCYCCDAERVERPEWLSRIATASRELLQYSKAISNPRYYFFYSPSPQAFTIGNSICISVAAFNSEQQTLKTLLLLEYAQAKTGLRNKLYLFTSNSLLRFCLVALLCRARNSLIIEDGIISKILRYVIWFPLAGMELLNRKLLELAGFRLDSYSSSDQIVASYGNGALLRQILSHLIPRPSSEYTVFETISNMDNTYELRIAALGSISSLPALSGRDTNMQRNIRIR